MLGVHAHESYFSLSVCLSVCPHYSASLRCACNKLYLPVRSLPNSKGFQLMDFAIMLSFLSNSLFFFRHSPNGRPFCVASYAYVTDVGAVLSARCNAHAPKCSQLDHVIRGAVFQNLDSHVHAQALDFSMELTDHESEPSLYVSRAPVSCYASWVTHMLWITSISTLHTSSDWNLVYFLPKQFVLMPGCALIRLNISYVYVGTLLASLAIVIHDCS